MVVPSRLVADDVGMDTRSLLFQILRLKPEFLSIPVLANLHTGSHKPRFPGSQVFLFQEVLHVLGR